MDASSNTLTTETERELATELARLAAQDAAPEELVLFDDTAAEYWADPQAVLDPARRDEAVGFGLDAALVTPLLISIAMPVVRYLADQIGAAVKDAAGPSLSVRLRRLLGLPAATPTAPATPALTAEQVARVRTVARDQALALGLPEERAGLLADAIAGRALAGA